MENRNLHSEKWIHEQVVFVDCFGAHVGKFVHFNQKIIIVLFPLSDWSLSDWDFWFGIRFYRIFSHSTDVSSYFEMGNNSRIFWKFFPHVSISHGTDADQ